jgi:hypothetical protein
MAEQEVTVDLNLDDKELFQSAREEPKQEEAPAPEVEERPRDELGRFAPKTEEKAEEPAPPVEAPPEQPKDDDGKVPSWRLRELREAREAAEKRAEEAQRQSWQFQQELQGYRRQLAEQNKPKQEPVNWFENPDGALKQQLSPFEEQFSTFKSDITFKLSRTMNIALHGMPAVKEAEEAVRKAVQGGNPEMRMLAQQMDASDDPVGVAVEWHKRAKLVEVTGGDPEKYRQQVRDELLKDPEFRKQVIELTRADADTRPNVQLPPSLSRTTGSGASTEAIGEADGSDPALFKHAMARRR